MKRKYSAAVIARIGVLSALAAVLYLWPEIPIIPPIYKLDLSNVPVLLAGYSMGLVPSAMVLLIKELTGLLHSATGGVGELADFLMSFAFVAGTLLIAKKGNRKRVLFGMIVGTLLAALAGAVSNYYILIPFYVGTQGISTETIVSMVSKTIPAVDSIFKLILLATVPFNLLKGAVISVTAYLLFKPLERMLHS